MSPPRAVVAVAASRGGLKALRVLLGALPRDVPAAVLVVLHLQPGRRSRLAEVLAPATALPVAEAAEGMPVAEGRVYMAPPGLHLLLRPEGTIALSDLPREHFSRPSADPLFRAVAEGWGERAVAVVLTGFGGDGSGGVLEVRRRGGTVVAQDRATSECVDMPESAVRTGAVQHVLPLEEIAPFLVGLLDTLTHAPPR